MTHIIRFAESILHGDQEHQDWLMNAAKKFDKDLGVVTAIIHRSSDMDGNQKEALILSVADRIQTALLPGPMCRDCGDYSGRCPNSGERCHPKEAAKELSDMVRALVD